MPYEEADRRLCGEGPVAPHKKHDVAEQAEQEHNLCALGPRARRGSEEACGSGRGEPSWGGRGMGGVHSCCVGAEIVGVGGVQCVATGRLGAYRLAPSTPPCPPIHPLPSTPPSTPREGGCHISAQALGGTCNPDITHMKQTCEPSRSRRGRTLRRRLRSS